MRGVPRLPPTLRIVQRLALSICGNFHCPSGGVAFGSRIGAHLSYNWLRKIVAATGNGSIAVTIENRSSLGRREGNHSERAAQCACGDGCGLIGADVASTPVQISLSENLTSYVWVAQISENGSDAMVVMVSIPRPAADAVPHESVPLSLRKTLLWTQAELILDVLVLEETSAACPDRGA